MLKARLAPDDVLGSEDIEDLVHDIKEPLLAHPLQELRARFIKKNQVGLVGGAQLGRGRVRRWSAGGAQLGRGRVRRWSAGGFPAGRSAGTCRVVDNGPHWTRTA